MEFLLELLLNLLAELFWQLLIKMGLELGFQLSRDAIRPTGNDSLSVARASAGQLALGMAAGFVTALFLPNRLLPAVAIPGISLVLSPIATGALMSLFGRWLRRRGNTPTSLASFRGGALFAFACAATRYLMVMGLPAWIGALR